MQGEDDGRIFGDLSSRVGKLCDPESSMANDCIQWNLESECTLSFENYLCHGVTEELNPVYVCLSREDTSLFAQECRGSYGGPKCDEVGNWVTDANRIEVAGRICP